MDYETIMFYGKQALKRYPTACEELKRFPGRMSAVKCKLYSPASAIVDGLPKSPNVGDPSEKWVNGISAKDKMYEPYYKAVSLFSDVSEALEALSDDEYDMLIAAYCEPGNQAGKCRAYCDKHRVSRRTYYNDLEMVTYMFSVSYAEKAQFVV